MQVFLMTNKLVDGDNGKKEAIHWTLDMDVAFINAMLKEKANGNKPEGTFITQTYTNMDKEFCKAFNTEVIKNSLKNRLKTIKKDFAQWYDVFHGSSLSGFSWDPVSGLFIVEEEVWDDLIAVCVDVIFCFCFLRSNYYCLYYD